jgi:hypothetical protein
MICRKCGHEKRYKESDWCVRCIYQTCCKNYPRINTDGTTSMCVHGGKRGKLFHYQ